MKKLRIFFAEKAVYFIIILNNFNFFTHTSACFRLLPPASPCFRLLLPASACFRLLPRALVKYKSLLCIFRGGEWGREGRGV
jgi:hypothetical protein